MNCVNSQSSKRVKEGSGAVFNLIDVPHPSTLEGFIEDWKQYSIDEMSGLAKSNERIGG